MKFEVTLDTLEDMAECIHNCSWVSSDEIYAYMKSCLTDGDYEPEDWSVDGRGLIEKDRNTVIDIKEL